jgi:aspartyl-tRNA(Asn)/glutamyl-tRNA(Gln) amidotransferase subunit A
MHGPGRNPWNPDHWAGGSSSGSGAAVAAGLTPFAIGSETWGSILSPSSYCGVTGLRPTYGLVSRHGAMALSWTMDKLGPLAHSAEDCAIVLAAMAGKDSKDASSSGASFYNLAEYGRELKELRIGFAEVDFDEWADSGSRPAFRQALDVLRAMGLLFKDFSLPAMPYSASAGTVIAAEGATIFEKLIRGDKFESLADEKQKAGLRAGLELSASDYLNAMRVRSIVQQKMREVFIDVDMIVSPATADTAPRVDQPLDAPRSGRPVPEKRGNRDLGAAGNLAGLPAICLPCGFAENGLPVAIQIVTRPNNELMLVAVGKEFQKRTDWHRRRPAV